jgi:aryl-alcohol dehydrogenase-like predicted oxidoreductase
MQKRPLGHSGLEVAPFAFGSNVFGWTVQEPAAFQLLDDFAEAGFNLIDTADIYGGQGGAEIMIGKWLKRRGRREDIIIASKVGKPMGLERQGLTKSYIRQAAEASLRRLQTNYIDLYQSHDDDLHTPLEESLAAFGQLIAQGKVRAIGASNYSGTRLAQALQVSREQNLPAYQSLQPLYNLYDRADYEANLEPLCREKGVGVLSYFSLASGFLTGKYHSEKDLVNSSRASQVKKYLNDRGLRIISALEQTAEEYQVPPAGIALAWLIARPGITAPIASATSSAQLQQLIQGAKLELSAAAADRLNQASAWQ